MDSSPVSAGTTPPQTLAVPAPSSLEVLWALQASPRCQHKPGLVLTTRWPVANGVLSWDWTNQKLGFTMARKPNTYIYIIFNILISYHHRKPSINLDSKGNPAIFFLRIWMPGKLNPMGCLVGSLQHPQKTDRKVMILDDGNQENPENKSRRVP